MSPAGTPRLTHRERQIMDVLYQRGSATVAEVLEGLPDPPSYSAVRATLRVLEDKGQVKHEQDGPRYLYLPAVAPEKARRAAVRHMVQTFFSGSVEQAVAALLQASDAELSAADLTRLAARIEQAKKEGR